MINLNVFLRFFCFLRCVNILFYISINMKINYYFIFFKVLFDKRIIIFKVILNIVFICFDFYFLVFNLEYGYVILLVYNIFYNNKDI